jgi:hypothetical protein
MVAAVRVAGALLVIVGAVALVGAVMRGYRLSEPRDRSGGDADDGRTIRPGETSQRDELGAPLPDDPERFDRELLSRLTDRRPDGAAVRLPQELPTPEGARVLAVPGLSGTGPAGRFAVECDLSRADAVDWLRGRMAQSGWKVVSVRPGAYRDDVAEFAREGLNRCWARIEDRPGGGCRIFYMLLTGKTDAKAAASP